ncbi:MAG: protoheme IX farnesyltransferase [Anaerolineae bacterium]|nr:protoheme IX farnesyltransferase [Anaerolineae bacterium]
MATSIAERRLKETNSPNRSALRDYLQLAKPRIVILLVFTTVTAMVVAARGTAIPALSVLATVVGGALASGGSSAINQYLDRDMDQQMSRTRTRPIPSGRIAPLNALIFGIALIASSVVVLGLLVNWLSALLALTGALYYVIVYTILLKRNTVLNILIGGGAGAIPVLVGWAAVTGTLEAGSLILFAIVFYWTPPHSWALALLVNTDYARANVPMMPVARGEEAARVQILLYAVQLVALTLLPLPFRILGGFYLLSAALLGAGMLWESWRLLREKTGAAARRTYKYSTFYLALLFLAMIIDVVIF